MEYVIKGRKPASLFRFFEEISAIPRPSYHEGRIADYLVDFAKARSLEYYRDELHNVLIKAPASVGCEALPPLLFQGHTDMVCEKNGGVEHDFLRDPLKLYVDGQFLRAQGTTLGADNGVAVAAMLSLLDGEIEKHPAYECLFTAAEEVGLDGATGFDYSRISARHMINMDSEGFGIVTAGCAGGIRSDLSLSLHPEPFAGECLRVSVRGLIGGHSGENINCGRANANKLMGRLLAALLPTCDARLVSVNGGSKDNAIPRECEVLLAIPNAADASELLCNAAAEIARELVDDDRNFSVTCEDAEPEAVMCSREDTLRTVAVLACVPNAVFEMNHRAKGMVEFSRNLGVVRTENDQISFVFASRSAMESRLDASIRELDALAAVVGCKTRHYNRYPGWNFSPVSAVRDAYLRAYRDVTGTDASVNVIHAGLECGIISHNIPGMDIISVGPNMHDIHSPDEALDLDSLETFWKTVEQLIVDWK